MAGYIDIKKHQLDNLLEFETNYTISELLRQIRMILNISRKNVAKNIGWSESKLYWFETERTQKVNLDSAINLALFYGIDTKMIKEKFEREKNQKE